MAKQQITLSTTQLPVTVAQNTVKLNNNFTELYDLGSELQDTKADLDPETNTVPPEQLPPAKLDEDQFVQPISGGKISIDADFFTEFVLQIGAVQGWGTGTPLTPLAAPVISVFGSTTSTQIGIQWPAVDVATGYDIYRDISGVKTKVGTTAGLNYLNTGLTPETSYTHYVKAITTTSGYSPSAFSNALIISTTASSGLPVVSATTPLEVVDQSWDATSHTLSYVDAGGNFPRSRFREYIPAGQDGYVEGTLKGIQLILDDLPGEFNNEPLFGIVKNMVNNHIDARYRDTDGTTSYSPLGIESNDVIGRLSAVGSNMLFQYRLVGSSTLIGTFTRPRPVGVDVYLKSNDGDTGYTLGDVKGAGLSLNNSL